MNHFYKMSFYTNDELSIIGFKSFGTNVLISRKASIYNPALMTIGSNTRIDDFTLLSGPITIGSYVHIAAFTGIWAKAEIIIDDFANISSGVKIYSQSDDFSGNSLTNPMVTKFKNLLVAPVYIGKHVVIGSGSVILPGVRLELGSSVGAQSLIKKNVASFHIVAGVDKFIKLRSGKLLELEEQFINDL